MTSKMLCQVFFIFYFQKIRKLVFYGYKQDNLSKRFEAVIVAPEINEDLKSYE
jgi:hypothetical protein